MTKLDGFINKSFLTIVFVFIFFHNVLVAESSGLPQVSSVYLGIEMIQPGKSFLMFEFKTDFPGLKSKFKNDFPGWIISMPR